MIYIVELEPVETRYTAQWKEHLPMQMKNAGLDVSIISGPDDAPQDTTPGAFLNFSGTNYWKSEQLKTISQMFAEGKIKDGDYFLYTDAWNPTVLQVKYMARLLQKDVKIGGMWHAGAYDPADFLGRLISHNEEWVRDTEKALFNTFDDNFFATQFHIDMFLDAFPELNNDSRKSQNLPMSSKIHQVGWPMEYLDKTLREYDIPSNKMDMVLFPHRLAPEKQVEIFKDLAKSMDDVEFVIAQEHNFTKDEYHTTLSRCKIVFSANLQETLGISCYEGTLVGAVPIVPNRLSYTEMYKDEFKYRNEWTSDWDSYLANKDKLIAFIRNVLDSYEQLADVIEEQKESLKADFFDGSKLYEIIKERNE